MIDHIFFYFACTVLWQLVPRMPFLMWGQRIRRGKFGLE